MTENTFNQLNFNTDNKTFAANSPAQQLLGLGAQGKETDLIQLLGQDQWQQLKSNAKSSQAMFVTASNQSTNLWLGQAAQQEIIWIISPQPNLQRQIEQWQHESRLASVGQVMAGICHEINQPLNAMRLRLFGLQELAKIGVV
ncbi:MAG: hypothetical protein ACPH5N_03460, partial [Pseudomonadales bacterium]